MKETDARVTFLWLRYLIGCFIVCSNLTFVFCQAETVPSASSHLDACLNNARQKVHKIVLDNGFTALLYPTAPESKTPEVITMLTFDIGSRDEEHGQFGFAHAVEHMIFKGTEKMSESDLIAIAEKFCIGSIGIGFNAYTQFDATTYYFKTDEKNWNVFLSILSDCMQNVQFAEHHFASEVKAIVNELKMYNKDPYRLVFNTLCEELYPPNHPYHHPLGGFKEDLLQATAQDVKKFYKKHYSPEKGLLLVVGNVDQDHFENQVRKNFANIPTQKNQEPTLYNDLPEQQIVKKEITFSKQIPAPIVFFAWKTVASSLNRKFVMAQDCIEYILKERLRPLKDSHHFVLNALTYGNIDRLGGFFFISINPKDEANKSWLDSLFNNDGFIKRSKKFILNQLNDLATNGPTEQELQNYKHASKVSLLNSFENPYLIAREFAKVYFLQRNEYQVFDDMHEAESIDAATIQDFCKQFLTSSRMNTITFKPIKKEEEEKWLEFQSKIDQADNKLLDQRIRDTEVEEARLVHTLPQAKLIDFNFEQPSVEYTLSNGLTVFIKQQKETPFIALSCGFKNDEKFSLYLENKNQGHIKKISMAQLIEGSKGFSKKDHIDFFDTLGAFYSFSSSGAFCSCLVEKFPDLLKRFAHIITQPSFPRTAFNQHIKNSIETITRNQQNEMYVAGKTLGDMLFKEYPWRKTDEQTIRLLESTWRNSLFQFHKTYVTPENMFLALVGDINLETIQKDLEEVFTGWKAGSHSKDALMFVAPDIENPSPQLATKEMPKEMAVLMLGRVTNYADSLDDIVLDLLEQYLNKQIFAIREKTGLFYGCSASLATQSFLTKGAAQIITLVTPKNLAATEQMLVNTLQSISTNGIPEYDLTIAKQTKCMSLAKAFANNRSLCSAYSMIIQSGKPWSYFNDLLTKINQVTIEEVNEVAKRYFDPSAWSKVRVGRVTDAND